MSDVAGAAPAAADSAPAPVDGAPISEQPVPNAALGSQVPAEAQAKAEPKAPPSIDDAIDRAEAKSAAKTAEAAKPEPKAEPKTEAKDAKPEPGKTEQPRENGRFVARSGMETVTGKLAEEARAAIEAGKPKPSHTAEDAPARFTDTAKAKWAAADPEIRGEVLRMQRELTDGYTKHKDGAEKWAGLKEFDEIATRSGTTVKDALARYVGMENKIREDLLGGIDAVIQNATNGKYSLREVAAHVMGQTPEDVQSQSDATIRELRATVQRLEQQVGGVVQNINTQREQSTLTEINKFAADHPRFEELADDIALFMKSGRAKDLPAAYEMAERLNPAPAKAAEPAASSAAIDPDPPAQPDKGQKSITGAPSAGLNSPGRKRVAKSLDDALDHAFGAVG